jgi:hypothetical protein
MTNEEFTLEILMEAESLGIRKEVLELSNKIKQENEFMDINSSIERAFQHMKAKLQEYNNVYIMTEDELEYWQSVQYRMDAEGFDYCFVSYSDWDEIKDEEFHRLRLGFLQHMKELRQYIDSKVEEGENLELEN